MKTHYLFGHIDAKAAEETIRAVHEGCHNILLNSSGGDIADALAIYDCLVKTPGMRVTVTGQCASAAVVVLLGAEERWATVNSRFMIHKPYVEEADELTPAELANARAEVAKLHQVLHDIYLERASERAASYLASPEPFYFDVVEATTNKVLQ